MLETATRKVIKISGFSILSNTILTAGKFFTCITIDSISIISKATHSLVDLIAAVIAYFAVREASEPADNDHPYGHGKFENISGTIETLLIFTAAIYIIYEATEKFVHSKLIEMLIVGVLIMLFSTVVNFLFQKNCLLLQKKQTPYSS